jgi:hypothetical protein
MEAARAGVQEKTSSLFENIQDDEAGFLSWSKSCLIRSNGATKGDCPYFECGLQREKPNQEIGRHTPSLELEIRIESAY